MKYTEGDWFGVPLRDGDFAIGVLARTNPEAALLGYFFGPRRLVLPSLGDVANLKASTAILVGRFGHLGLTGGAWPIIGRVIDWNRADWPTPVFARHEELTDRWILVTYDDDDPAKRLRDEPVSAVQASGLPQDGLMGSGFVELRLTRLLGRDGPSREHVSVDFGCAYCADDQNRWYGHVTQVSSNSQTRLILLRCPRCGSLYSNAPRGPDQTRRLTVEAAREAFPDWTTPRDIPQR